MSKLDSESYINVRDTQDEQISHTPETLQIHMSYKYSTDHISWIHVMKNIKISYQLVRRQET